MVARENTISPSPRRGGHVAHIKRRNRPQGVSILPVEIVLVFRSTFENDSIGDLVLRTFGDGVEERSDAVRRSTHLTGGAISLQHSPDGSKRRGQECGTSLSVGVDGGLAAVLAVDRPSGPVDFLALDVQVICSIFAYEMVFRLVT